MRLNIELRIFIGLVLFSSAFLSRAQVVQHVQQMTATNPKYPEFYDPPFQSQLKSLVQGSKAESLPESRVRIQDAKVQDFETNGQTKLVIETPRCIYDRAGHAINSAESLHAQTGDGKFMIDGTGFLYLQTNGWLFISNRVHTFVQADLLQSASNTASGTAPRIGDLEITSDRLVFVTNGIATYTGNAHASSTNLSLKGGSIVVLAPNKQLERLTVETNVVMDYENIHVEGEHAAYTAQDGIARVTGHPKWRSEDREGYADELSVDSTNKVFRANRQAFFQFSTLNLSNSTFIPAQSFSDTNAATATNRFVQVTSDFYEFHTNHAQFGDHVVMTEIVDAQPRGTLTCGALDVAFTGTNELESMVARTNVVITRDTNRLTGAIATYTAAARILELTGEPAWQRGPQQGKGQTISIYPYDEKMLVRGDAWARVPAKELGSAMSLGANGVATTNATAAKEEFADIYSDEYTFKTNQARFLRHVRIVDPQMNWSCDKVSIDSQSATEKNTTLLAEGSVNFAMSSENQPPVHGTCERAEYVCNDTVNPIVDRMEMTGHPVLETTNSVLRNAIIIYDKTTHRVFLPGEYAMSGTGNAFGTNASPLIPNKR